MRSEGWKDAACRADAVDPGTAVSSAVWSALRRSGSGNAANTDSLYLCTEEADTGYDAGWSERVR